MSEQSSAPLRRLHLDRFLQYSFGQDIAQLTLRHYDRSVWVKHSEIAIKDASSQFSVGSFSNTTMVGLHSPPWTLFVDERGIQRKIKTNKEQVLGCARDGRTVVSHMPGYIVCRSIHDSRKLHKIKTSNEYVVFANGRHLVGYTPDRNLTIYDIETKKDVECPSIRAQHISRLKQLDRDIVRVNDTNYIFNGQEFKECATPPINSQVVPTQASFSCPAFACVKLPSKYSSFMPFAEVNGDLPLRMDYYLGRIETESIPSGALVALRRKDDITKVECLTPPEYSTSWGLRFSSQNPKPGCVVTISREQMSDIVYIRYYSPFNRLP